MPNSEDFKQHKKRQRRRNSERRQVALDELLGKLPPWTSSALSHPDEDHDAVDISKAFLPIPPLLQPEDFWCKVPVMCNPTTAVMDETLLEGVDNRKLGQNQRRQAKMKRKLEAREERGEITKDEQAELWKEHGRTHHQQAGATYANTRTEASGPASGTTATSSIALLSANRGKRKCWQVENFVALLKGRLLPGMRVVDFGSGSGNLCLALAAYFPNVRFVLVDRTDYSLELVQKRAETSGLTNIQVQCFDFKPDNLKEYRPPPSLIGESTKSSSKHFDLGIGLHCCGSFTDMVMEVCRQQQADCIVCPCCNGGITKTVFSYPRSAFLKSCLTADEYLGQLSRSADNQHNYTAKCWIEYDRALWAHEQGLQVELWKLTPAECTPKHHVLYLKHKGRMGSNETMECK